MQPSISVIMPAYNAQQFLALAIQSVLCQTFFDFEFLIINDGSTDNSLNIIKSFSDKRIVILNNTENIGLVNSLNKAIALAKGKYIARMDADDICMPSRLAEQYEFLEANSFITVVATFIDFIDENGKKTGYWALDRKANTQNGIKNISVKECCIAHPTIMINTIVAQKYKYNPSQLHCEDYDLWLRLLADGYKIGKINDPLLMYRVHSKSITQIDNKKVNTYFKIANCKKKFLLQSNTISAFRCSVFINMCSNYMLGFGKMIKNILFN